MNTAIINYVEMVKDPVFWGFIGIAALVIVACILNLKKK